MIDPENLESAQARLREQMKRTAGERTLTPSDVEAIAEVLAQKVAAVVKPPPPQPSLIDVRELAGELGVSPTFVYEHASELGAMRLGLGPNARIRFDLEEAKQALAARRRRPPARGRRART